MGAPPELPVRGVAGGDLPSLTSLQAAEQMLRPGRLWADRGQATTVTYAYEANPTGIAIGGWADAFVRASAAQINDVEQAVSVWQTFANIRFERVGAGTTGEAAYSDDATILVSSYTSSTGYGSSSAAFPGDRSSSSYDGDILMGPATTGNMYLAALHEIGHALGLDHPSVSYVLNSSGQYIGSYREDSVRYSIMSYVYTGLESGYFRTANSTPMMDDITAIQIAYGANYGTRSDDTIYGFGTNAGSIYSVLDTRSYAIWDGGGNDTINFSGYSRDQVIDLREGAISYSGANEYVSSRQEVSIAYGAIIENAIGGTGADLLIGNAAANKLFGGSGNDKIFGGDGNDVLDGGGGSNALDGGAGNDTVNYEAAGTAVVVQLSLQGAAQKVNELISDELSSIENVTGSNFSDRISGDDNNNYLNGMAGDDVLFGGAGDDVLVGGAGFDRASYTGTFRPYAAQASAGSLVIQGAVDEGRDTLISVESVTFRDGIYVVDGDSIGAQVTRLYDTVLQRGADPIGLDFWLDQIQENGATLNTVAASVLSSPEFQAATGTLSNTAFVEYIYQQALGRAADPGGSSYWTSQLDGGLPRSSMLIGFSESVEHRGLTADLVGKGYFDTDDTYQAVALLYDSFTGRLPDTGGLTFWSEQVKTGARTLTQVANEFAASGEFTNAIAGKNNGQLVDFMYQNTLDRGPDASGRAFWVNQLDAGLSKGALLLSFSQSAEHYGLKAADIIGGIKVAGSTSGTAAFSPVQGENMHDGASLSSAAPASAFILENAEATSLDVAQAMWLNPSDYADASMPAYIDMAHVF